MITDDMKKVFELWVHESKKCPCKQMDKCLFTGTMCAYVQCLFKGLGITTKLYADIPCPKCKMSIKYPLELKCKTCGFEFTQLTEEQLTKG